VVKNSFPSVSIQSKRRLLYRHRSRMAAIPPGYNSGRVSIFREPHTLHFMRLPTNGTGVSPGSGRLRGSKSRSRQHSVQ
jgi:hypothetical protein